MALLKIQIRRLKTFVILFCFLSNQQTQAQQTQSLYLELLGSALGYSVNYDTRFSSLEESGLGMRIGIFYAPDRGDSYICVPLHLNYLFGEGRKQLELGFGLSAFLTDSPITRDQNIFPSGAIMYRWRPSKSGFLLRMGLAPIFIRVDGDSDGIPPPILWLWPGFSFGYKF